MRKPIIITVLLSVTILALYSQAPTLFKHPGIFSSQAQLDFIKSRVAENNGSPLVGGYNKMAGENLGGAGYDPTPYANVHVIASGTNAEETAFRQDAHALYIQTIKWVVTGETVYRDNAIEIANDWAGTFQTLVAEVDHPMQTTLESSWALPIWVAGAEILRNYNDGASGWSESDIVQFESFVRKMLFYVNGSIASAANWYISRYLALMSAGVFLDSSAIYNSGYNNVIGQINAITIDGDIPELTRDFVHSQYVLIGLSQCAEIAHNQGDDQLFTRRNGASESRLLIGAESYVQCVMGLTTPDYYSSSDWARHSAPYEILLARYTQLGEYVPNVEDYVLTQNRPENGSENHFVGWLTATHGEITSEPTAVAENMRDRSPRVLPNPADDFCMIQTGYNRYSVYVFDCAGRLVIRKSDLSGAGTMNISELKKGIYLVNIISSEGNTVCKLVKN